MTIEQTQAVLTSYLQGHNLEALTQDAVFTMMPTGEETHGREAIAQMLQYFYSQAFDARFESTNRLFAENNAVVEGFMVGQHIGEFAGIPATGKPVRVPMCIVYDVIGEQIRSARVYFQMASLMQQITEPPSAPPRIEESPLANPPSNKPSPFLPPALPA